MLDEAIIKVASEQNVDIETAERKQITDLYPDDEDRQPEGTLIAWRQGSADELALAGILHVILALIMVNGRVLNDSER